MEKNNITSNKNNISKGKYEKYINDIFTSENEQTIIILISFLDYEDLLNFQQLNKYIYTILKNRKIIKKYAILGCITEKNRLLFYTSNIDINKMKETILKELIDYNIHNKLYENIKKLSNEKQETDQKLKKICLEIEKDITRTFYTEKFTQGNGNGILQNILNSVAFIRPEIGYCQGMNFIAGALINFIENEQICFWIFLSFIDDIELNLLFLKNMPDYNIRIFQLNYYIKLYFPDLFNHLEKSQINADLFFSKWIITIFSNYLPFNVLYKVWDIFIIDKWKAIFKFSMIFLYFMKKKLMKMDLNAFSLYFKSNAQNFNQMNFKDIIQQYKNYKITNKKLNELREEFFIEQVKQKLYDPKNAWETDQNECIEIYNKELNNCNKKEEEMKNNLLNKIDKINKEFIHAKKSYEQELHKLNKLKIKLDVLIEEKNGYEIVIHRNNTHKNSIQEEEKLKDFIILNNNSSKENKNKKHKSFKNIFKGKSTEEKMESKLKKISKELDSINNDLIENFQLVDSKKHKVDKLNKKLNKYKTELKNLNEKFLLEKKQLLKNLSEKLKLSAKFVLTNKY